MVNHTETKIYEYIVHQLGNRVAQEGCKLSKFSSAAKEKEEFLRTKAKF